MGLDWTCPCMWSRVNQSRSLPGMFLCSPPFAIVGAYQTVCFELASN
jgi:hypothetical protein